ncbi:MAG: hypothetical protein NTX97_01725 [Bacteroidetes bacterium]|nr:hypothetical protein [Bacteroidota bacterium]
MEENIESNWMEARLPQFLKVLCILTFIGAGLGLLSGLYNLVKAPTAIEDYEKMQEMTANMNSGFMTMMTENAHAAALNALPLAISSIGTSLFCLFGALMMWKLRKVGFYAYVCGQVLSIAIPFIIMYSVNLKHMS